MILTISLRTINLYDLSGYTKTAPYLLEIPFRYERVFSHIFRANKMTVLDNGMVFDYLNLLLLLIGTNGNGDG